MPKHKADLYTIDIVEYITQRVGLTPQQAKRVIFALSEFLVISLIRRLKVVLPFIGNLSVQENKSRNTIKFAPTDQMYAWIKNSKIGYKPEGLELVPELVAAVGEQDFYLQRLEKRLEEQQRLDQLPELYLKDISLVQLDFLVYLQQEFPYNKLWVNPISKREHPANKVKEVLELTYSKICPEEFTCLYLLWVGCNKRRELAVLKGYTPELLRRSWGRAVDSILLLLEFPEITPNLVIALTKPR
jgi:nucleoid DNA-binding protein